MNREELFTLSRKDWKKVVYYYKKIVRPVPGVYLMYDDPFNRLDAIGPACERTFFSNVVFVVLTTLISSSVLNETQRRTLETIREKVYMYETNN